MTPPLIVDALYLVKDLLPEFCNHRINEWVSRKSSRFSPEKNVLCFSSQFQHISIPQLSVNNCQTLQVRDGAGRPDNKSQKMWFENPEYYTRARWLTGWLVAETRTEYNCVVLTTRTHQLQQAQGDSTGHPSDWHDLMRGDVVVWWLLFCVGLLEPLLAS